MRSMQQQLGNLGTISVFARRHRETKKHLRRGGRSQDLPYTDFQPEVRQSSQQLWVRRPIFGFKNEQCLMTPRMFFESADPSILQGVKRPKREAYYSLR